MFDWIAYIIALLEINILSGIRRLYLDEQLKARL